MRTFEQRGMIVRRQGVGTYVTSPPQVIETGLEVLQSLEALAERSGLKVEMGDLEIKERTPDGEERRMLKVAEGATIVEVARVILAKGRPVAYLVDCVPEGMLPGEIQEGAFSGSVLDAFLRWGETELAFSRTEITAVAADPEVARHLRIQRGDVLLEFEAYLYTRDGRAVDHSCSFFLPGVFRFHILRRVGP
jgi:GntR family transcriptional regulator